MSPLLFPFLVVIERFTSVYPSDYQFCYSLAAAVPLAAGQRTCRCPAERCCGTKIRPAPASESREPPGPVLALRSVLADLVAALARSVWLRKLCRGTYVKFYIFGTTVVVQNLCPGDPSEGGPGPHATERTSHRCPSSLAYGMKSWHDFYFFGSS